jgi:hypothetical protein
MLPNHVCGFVDVVQREAGAVFAESAKNHTYRSRQAEQNDQCCKFQGQPTCQLHIQLQATRSSNGAILYTRLMLSRIAPIARRVNRM